MGKLSVDRRVNMKWTCAIIIKKKWTLQLDTDLKQNKQTCQNWQSIKKLKRPWQTWSQNFYCLEMLWGTWSRFYIQERNELDLRGTICETTEASRWHHCCESVYRQAVIWQDHWCSQNHLEPNPFMAVEMTEDFRRTLPTLPPLFPLNKIAWITFDF